MEGGVVEGAAQLALRRLPAAHEFVRAAALGLKSLIDLHIDEVVGIERADISHQSRGIGNPCRGGQAVRQLLTCLIQLLKLSVLGLPLLQLLLGVLELLPAPVQFLFRVVKLVPGVLQLPEAVLVLRLRVLELLEAVLILRNALGVLILRVQQLLVGVSELLLRLRLAVVVLLPAVLELLLRLGDLLEAVLVFLKALGVVDLALLIVLDALGVVRLAVQQLLEGVGELPLRVGTLAAVLLPAVGQLLLRVQDLRHGVVVQRLIAQLRSLAQQLLHLGLEGVDLVLVGLGVSLGPVR